MRYSMTRTTPWLAGAAVAALLTAPPPALAVPDFRVVTVCESTTVVAGSLPVSHTQTCGGAPFGSFQASAAASFGGVGAEADASTFRFDAAGNAQASASFLDAVTFTKTDPSAPDEFLVSVNLDFGGILNIGGADVDSTAAQYGFRVAGFVGEFRGRGVLTLNRGLEVIPSGLGEGEGIVLPGPDGFGAVLRSPSVLLNFSGRTSFQELLALELDVAASSGGPGGSALADFSGTLEFPTGTDVFNLPPGYTVNAGDYLVNNRFVSGPAAVSLPPTLALLVAGAVALVVARHRR